ncbi:MAG: 4-phosphopantetheinyl transferase family protein [Bacteroidetes bacterium]|nr:4-phosphopantetheinyl transferase family protein [Bacteroidota bacterium]
MLDLEAFCRDHDIIKKREGEQRATELLLKNLFPQQEVILNYSAEGKPFLSLSSAHISISHSHDKLVIMLNEKESTGVDVELIRDKVKNIRHKFLCEEELEFAGNNTETLTVLWAAKEAVYKAYGLKGVDFCANIFIEPFDEGGDLFYGSLHMNNKKTRYLLKKEKHGDYILVYILNEV